MFDIMFTIVPLIVMCGFIYVFGMLIYRFVSYLNDKAKPVETYQAKVIAKRTNVSRHHHNHDGHVHHSTSTTYYATFELISGERVELKIPSSKIGYLIEGDEGTLQYQGRLFVNFERCLQL